MPLVIAPLNVELAILRIAVDEKNVRDARCVVTYITRRILKDSLDLLGIGCVERM